MTRLARLIAASVVTRSVFQRFAQLSDEDKTAVVDAVKERIKGKKPKDEEAPAEETDTTEDVTTEETDTSGDTGAPDSVGEAVEEGIEESESGTGDEPPDMQSIVDDLVNEVQVIKSDGQITPAEVLGLVDNIVQMVSVLINAKPGRKSRSAGWDEKIVDRLVTAELQTPFERALEKAIASAISEAKRDGTVSMSMENLMQMVRSPSPMLDGAPKGANARYYYKEMFGDIAKGFRFVRG